MRVCPKCNTKFPSTERFCLAQSCSTQNVLLVENIDLSRIGKTIGNYRLHEILGRGGMGTVYAGEHIYIRKKVAVKILHPQFAQYDEAVNRFLREARAASAINHPNIVDVTDFGPTPEGGVYFVMEYIAGWSLEELLDSHGGLELHRTLNIANQITQALQAAHEMGIVHRDLKPENIMLLPQPGRRDVIRMLSGETEENDRNGNFVVEKEHEFDFVKVLDFGIAKVLSQEGVPGKRITLQGAVFGTPEYMSPEAARGEDVDHRSDIYSLGVILFDMLCGRPPFEAELASDVLSMHITHAPPIPIDFAPSKEITESANRVILKALAKNPANRYQSMNELRDDLNECYGRVSYRRNAPQDSGIHTANADARTKRLTDDLGEWLTSDESSLSIDEARALALINEVNPICEDSDLEAALERALDDEEE